MTNASYSQLPETRPVGYLGSIQDFGTTYTADSSTTEGPHNKRIWKELLSRERTLGFRSQVTEPEK
jgi:hypothetical protein